MTDTIRALLEDISDFALAECLRARGWLCSQRNMFEWETPLAFNRRHGRHKAWLCQQIERNGKHVPEFEAVTGKSGRIIKLRSNLNLEAYAKPHDHRRTNREICPRP